MFDPTFVVGVIGILNLSFAIALIVLVGWLIESNKYKNMNGVQCGSLMGITICFLLLGVSLIKQSGNGILLSDKALRKDNVYLTVSAGKFGDQQVAILESNDGVRAYELQKVPPRIFVFTNNSEDPYLDLDDLKAEGQKMTNEEFIRFLNASLKALKKSLPKSTTVQNGQ